VINPQDPTLPRRDIAAALQEALRLYVAGLASLLVARDAETTNEEAMG
jgi:hypothetical protein